MSDSGVHHSRMANLVRLDPDYPTSNFCPIASVQLCSVARVGFNILPVSNRDKAGGSILIRAANSARVRPCDSRTVWNCFTKFKIAVKFWR